MVSRQSRAWLLANVRNQMVACYIVPESPKDIVEINLTNNKLLYFRILPFFFFYWLYTDHMIPFMIQCTSYETFPGD